MNEVMPTIIEDFEKNDRCAIPSIYEEICRMLADIEYVSRDNPTSKYKI